VRSAAWSAAWCEPEQQPGHRRPSSSPGTDAPQLQDALHPCVQMLLDLWDDLTAVFAQAYP